MKILMTGANGLLGSHATRHLLKSGHQVHAVVHSSATPELEGSIPHVVDLSSNWSASSLPDTIDAVIHLAQSAHFREFPEKALDVFGVNVAATARLLDYARTAGARKFILASSGGVYGTGEQAFSENAPIPPLGQLGYYLASKLSAEALAHNYASLMDVSVLRIFFMYGQGQKRSMLIPRLIDNVLAGQALNLQGPEGIRINPVHVSDAVTALEECLQTEGSHTFNIAGREVMSLREIAKLIGQSVGREPAFNVQQAAPGHLIANIDAMCSRLAAPRISFADGIRDLIPR